MLDFDSKCEALRQDVEAAGGFKRVGHRLWPAMDRAGRENASAQKLRDSLDPGRKDRLSDDEELHVKRMAIEACGRSVALEWECEALGMTRPQVVPATDTMAALNREFDGMVGKFERLLKRAEDLRAPPPEWPQAVKAAK